MDVSFSTLILVTILPPTPVTPLPSSPWSGRRALPPTPVTPLPSSPWSGCRAHSNWWYDLGTDWEVSNTLWQRSQQYAAYRQISRQMNYYAPALHFGRLNTGDLRHPAKYQPRDRAYGKKADFNQRELQRGVFGKLPNGEWIEATEADVKAGLAKCKGDRFKLPTGVTVFEDGSFTVETKNKQNPCALRPCRKFKVTDCSKEADYIARCDSRKGPFQLDLVWTNGENMDIRAIAIDASTGEVLEDGAGSDEISHEDVSGANGAIVPANKKYDDAKGYGLETMLLTTLPDGSDYKDHVYALMAHRAWPLETELAFTGARLVVRYGGVVVATYHVPQGPLVNPPNNQVPPKIRGRYLLGCFKPGPNGHYLDTSVAMYEWGGKDGGRVRMAELCRPSLSELCNAV